MRNFIEFLEPRLQFSAYQPDVTFGAAGSTRVPLIGGPVLVREVAGGNVLAVGTARSGNVALVRFTPGGFVDETFGPGGIVKTPIVGESISAAIQGDGKIVVLVQRGASVAVARFKSNGSLDKKFSGNGSIDALSGAGQLVEGGIAIGPDGTIAATGFTADHNTPFLFRLTSNGHLDAGFDGDGKAIVSFRPYNLAIQPDGKIIVAGYVAQAARFTTAGALDPTFGDAGVFTNSNGIATAYTRVAIDNNGSILLAGFVHGSFNGSYLVRLSSTGHLLTTFPITNDGNDTPVDLVVNPDSGDVTVLSEDAIQQFTAAGEVIDSGESEQTLLEHEDHLGKVAALTSSGELLVGTGGLPAAAPTLFLLTTIDRPEVALGANGTLVITGTASADTIGVTLVDGSVRVRRNGKTRRFGAADVQRLDIASQGGNDLIDWSGVSLPARCDAGLGNDSATAGAGDDYIIAGAGKDSIHGGAGDDRINGNSNADHLFGDAGNDNLRGGPGDDALDGGAGVDSLFGDAGADTLTGDNGNDKLYADTGDDFLDGGKGADIIDGGDGSDTATADVLDRQSGIEK